MRRLIFFIFSLLFSPVFCTITISITGQILAARPHPLFWAREDGDLDVLQIFRWPPQENQTLQLEIATNGELTGTVMFTFRRPAETRRLFIKDLDGEVIAQTADFSVLDPAEVVETLPVPSSTFSPSESPTSQLPKPSKTSISSATAASQRSAISNPAVWGSIVGASTVVIVIIVMLLFFLWRLKRRRKRELILRDKMQSYTHRFRFSTSSEPPVDPPPLRPKRDEEDGLYSVSAPNSVHYPDRESTLTVNTTAGRVHSHQASLTLISPLTPYGSSPTPSVLSPPDLRFLTRYPSSGLHSPAPSIISPSSPYGDSASILSFPDRRLLQQDSQSPISPAINSPPVLLSPPERFGSRDSKRYLAYLEARRAAADPPQNVPTSPNEDDSDWRTSWQDVADPPPSYPGHNS